MASGYACQHCSRLPPPPKFTISPPPNLLAIEVRCSSRSSLSSSIENKRSTSSSSSSSSVSIVLGIVIACLITTSTIVLLKKRRQGHRTKSDDTMMISSSSVRFSGHHHQHDSHQLKNWTKLIPLLSDSSSSDQTCATTPNEYPCHSTAAEPLLARDVHHEYEQIKCDDSLSGSLHYYCLVYCRQCANYHPTSSSSSSSSSLCPRSNLARPCYLPVSTNPTCHHQCACYHRTCHQRNDNRFFEPQPILGARTDQSNNGEDFRHPLNFIDETSSTCLRTCP